MYALPYHKDCLTTALFHSTYKRLLAVSRTQQTYTHPRFHSLLPLPRMLISVVLTKIPLPGLRFLLILKYKQIALDFSMPFGYTSTL